MTTKARRFAWGVVGLLAGILFASFLVTPVVVSQIRTTQVTNTQKSDARDQTLVEIQHLARRIRSCTSPHGKCARRGQRQTAKAVGDINRVVILAAACASQMPGASVDAISRCVMDGLESS